MPIMLMFTSNCCSPRPSRLLPLGEAAFVASASGEPSVGHENPIQTGPLFAEDSVSDQSKPPLRMEAEETPLITSPAAAIDKYHLIWSPGAWKKLIVGTSTLFVVHATSGLVSWNFGDLESSLATPMGSLFGSVVLPMLASACCLLQLGLNLLSVGCAGFNTVLGPLRPYFISLLLYLTAVSRFSKHTMMMTSSWRWTTVTAMRWAVALLPEALHLWNNRATFLPRKNPEAATNSKLHAVVQLEIPTMGCVACVNSVNKALNELDQVVTAKSSLKDSGGQAEVKIAANTQAEVDAIVASLTNAVNEAGFFGSTVESVQVQTNAATS